MSIKGNSVKQKNNCNYEKKINKSKKMNIILDRINNNINFKLDYNFFVFI
jgi:uncharacterized FlaG/YvyC family protein